MTSVPAPPIEPQARRAVFLDKRMVQEAIRVWPAPSCWRWWPGQGWEERRPWIHPRLASNPWPHPTKNDLTDLRGWKPRVELLLQDVPLDVRQLLRPLGDGVSWAVLKLVAAVPEITDLARDNISLVGLLALTAEGASEGFFREIRALLELPRRELLPLLGLPPNRSLLRMLAKLGPDALSAPGPGAIVGLLGSPDRDLVKVLRHLPHIRSDLIQVIPDPELRRLSSHALLTDPTSPLLVGLNVALGQILVARREGRAPARPARFASRREVADSLRIVQHPPRRWAPDQFMFGCAPPAGENVLLGDPPVQLEPITTPTEMLEYGICDKACIPTESRYPQTVMEGEGAMFKATWSDHDGVGRRATAWLVRWSERWVLSELAGPANGIVPDWLVQRLRDWSWELEQVYEDPPEPLREPEPDPQLLLPLGWSPSPLDGPSLRRTTCTKRPQMDYDDWWDTDGWLFQWEWL